MNSNVMQIIGGIFILLGLIDFGASYFGHDLTGVQWSAYVAGIIGYAFIHFASKFESAEAGNENTEEEIQEINSSTDLWNPNVTANWSIIFTPIFGGFIMSNNWKTLGKEALSKKSLIWAYIGIALIVVNLASSLYLASIGDLITAGIVSGVINLTFVIYFLIWRFTVAKEQIAYFKETLTEGYTKKSWSKPMLSVLAAFILLIAISFAQSFPLSIPSAYSEQTKLVKNNKIGSCPNYTLEELVDSEVIISNPAWETNITEDNEVFVNITGSVSYDNKPSKILIQFLFDKNNVDFAYNAYEIDGEAQETSVVEVLFETICENMETSNAPEIQGTNKTTSILTFKSGEWYNGYYMKFIEEKTGIEIEILSGDTLDLIQGKQYTVTYETQTREGEGGEYTTLFLKDIK